MPFTSTALSTSSLPLTDSYSKVVIARRNDEAIYPASDPAIKIVFPKIGTGYRLKKPSRNDDNLRRFISLKSHVIYIDFYTKNYPSG
ncbi:hypothetical protein QF042_001968 [Pedobacter sp. W3I1]|nr:hypothetical protein [Pedobacter sp. W3I1]